MIKFLLLQSYFYYMLHLTYNFFNLCFVKIKKRVFLFVLSDIGFILVCQVKLLLVKSQHVLVLLLF